MGGSSGRDIGAVHPDATVPHRGAAACHFPLIELEGVGTRSDGGIGDPVALGIIAFKTTVGFGAVLAIASTFTARVMLAELG